MLNNFKILATDVLHMSKDALHIHVGIGLYVLFLVVLKKNPSSPVPWLLVLAVELINETLDLAHERDFSGAIVDIVNTMLWPTIALVVARTIAARSKQTA